MDNISETTFNNSIEEFAEFASGTPSFWYFVEEAFIILNGIVGITLNASIAYCIFRFKNMQNRLNILLSNWAICCAFLYLTSSDTYEIIAQIFGIPWSSRIHCIFYDLLPAFLCACSMFMFLISLDSTFTKMSDSVFKKLLIIIWTMVLFYGIVNTGLCFASINFYFVVDGLLFLACNALILIRYIIYIKDCICKNTTKNYHYRQTVTGFYALSLIVAVVTTIIRAFCYRRGWCIIFKILYQIYNCHPIILVFIFTKFDENIKLCLVSLYNCKHNYIGAAVRYKQDLDDEKILANNEIEASHTNVINIDDNHTI